ncbi:MAG: HoxN/HupN/NixA family nickel/cobalt transporter [Alicyclobacillus shizuokensis]|nr:HoxN/HupN/NixA family nickel/cobalt transporter [Alicyclobacillus shizuokensis]
MSPQGAPCRRTPEMVMGVLQCLGWGAWWLGAHHLSSLWTLGPMAYLFGLRHAVDADHMVAIDTTTRKLLHEGSRPRAVGLYFSLGHSTVVFGLVAVLAVCGRHWVATAAPVALTLTGSLVSATFLYVVAIWNAAVLWTLLRKRRLHAGTEHRQAPAGKGILSTVFGVSLRWVNRDWHMYFVGLLFGLGFDTATEIALLAFGTATIGDVHTNAWSLLETLSVLVLPLLFSAGMSLLDGLDGLCMARAYGWANQDPVRRWRYNVAVTALSAGAAWMVGTFEWTQIFAEGLVGTMWQAINLGEWCHEDMWGLWLTGLLLCLWGMAWLRSLRTPRARGGAGARRLSD